MQFWLLVLLITTITSPFAFYCWYEWTYRWEIFDGGADKFWRRLRTDLHLSWPGRHGKIARITRVRAWVRKYAKMESPNTIMPIRGVEEPFRRILKEKRYAEYEHVFLRPKWLLWVMMLLSPIWPVVIISHILLFAFLVIWFNFIRPPVF